MSLASINSSAIQIQFYNPIWDTEGLTSSYSLNCSNDMYSACTTVMSNVNTAILALNTGGGSYQCCVVAVTSNGNGPEYCVIAGILDMHNT